MAPLGAGGLGGMGALQAWSDGRPAEQAGTAKWTRRPTTPANWVEAAGAERRRRNRGGAGAVPGKGRRGAQPPPGPRRRQCGGASSAASGRERGARTPRWRHGSLGGGKAGGPRGG
eukprot:4334627-Pleurochrysis_carterae.AAC.2